VVPSRASVREITIQACLPIPAEHLQPQDRLPASRQEGLKNLERGIDVRAIPVFLSQIDDVPRGQVGDPVFKGDRTTGPDFNHLPFLQRLSSQDLDRRSLAVGRQGPRRVDQQQTDQHAHDT
jgi:hypothetical protein